MEKCETKNPCIFLGEEYLISEATPVITKMTELKWLIITDARMD